MGEEESDGNAEHSTTTSLCEQQRHFTFYNVPQVHTRDGGDVHPRKLHPVGGHRGCKQKELRVDTMLGVLEAKLQFVKTRAVPQPYINLL